MTKSVQDFLESQGIDLTPDEIRHYGVKGMKWNKNKTVEELKLELAEKAAGLKAKGRALAKEAGLFDEKRVYGQPTGAKVVTDGTGSKPKKDIVFTGVKGKTVVKQGKVNAFIEKAFKKLTNKPVKDLPKPYGPKVTSITGLATGTRYNPKNGEAYAKPKVPKKITSPAD